MTMSRAEPSNVQPSRAGRWLREPLLHFLVIGGVLFAVYGALNPQTGDRFQSNQIRLTRDDLRQMAVVWAVKWQRPPTPEEMHSLIENKIRDEMLYREALALGLDQDDTIVRRRLAQKMEFLAEDTAAIRDPAGTDLKAWFEEHRERFALPDRISFGHVYFSPDRRGQGARDAAAHIGDRFMFQDYYADRVPEQVASVFGTAFAQSLSGLKPGVWQGPVESGLGWHLVFIDSMTPGRVPTFEEIEPDVRAEWINAQRAEAKRRIFAVMRARYEVVLPPPDAKDAPVAGTAAAMKSK
jgi:hypothetical protein